MRYRIFFPRLLSSLFFSFISTQAFSETNINLNGKLEFYIESHLPVSYHDYGSDYALIVPSGEFFLKRTKNERDVSLDSIIDENKNYKRYHQGKGFAFIRKADDNIFYNASTNKIKDDIEKFLTKEGNQYEVFFFDKSFLSLDSVKVECEGNIFSSTSGAGHFFLMKQKPKLLNGSYLDTNGQSYFLIYYNFKDDYEVAKLEFHKLLSYVYQIHEGKLLY